MSSELAVLTTADVSVLAKHTAKSGLYKMTEDQAFTLMMICQSEGLHPMEALKRYHIINGRPSLRSDFLLAEFQRAGGTVEWLTPSERDATECRARFTNPTGQAIEVHWDLAKAKKAGIAGKDNWNNYPGPMLRARCITEGVRAIWPAACFGSYSDEECEDMTPKHGSLNGSAVSVSIAALPPAEKNTRFRKILARLLDRADKQYRAEFGESYEFDDQAFEDLTRGSLLDLDCIKTIDADLDEILNAAKDELESHIRAVFSAKRESLQAASVTHEREPGEDG